MKFGKLFSLAAGTVAAVCFAAAAQAEPLYFFGNGPTTLGQFPTDPAGPNYEPVTKYEAFLAAVAVGSTQDFENSPVTAISNSDNALGVFGTGTLTQSQPAFPPYRGAEVRNGAGSNGRFNTTGLEGAAGGWLQTDSSFTIDLGSTSVGAFGFFGTDFGDFTGNLQIAIYAADGELIDGNIFTANDANDPLALRDTSIMDSQDGSLIFFGYASDRLFSKLVFTVGQTSTPGAAGEPPTLGRDILGFDDLMIGNLRTVTPPPPPNPTPEPGSLVLVGLALFAAGWARKTQQRA
ncbi:MAG: PEP-CTERM sorting domain-containing protein [Rubrivivax sp.]|nr:PEP-CTERM sorting domain-containing protein [Rubrivivax sp.]